MGFDVAKQESSTGGLSLRIHVARQIAFRDTLTPMPEYLQPKSSNADGEQSPVVRVSAVIVLLTCTIALGLGRDRKDNRPQLIDSEVQNPTNASDEWFV